MSTDTLTVPEITYPEEQVTPLLPSEALRLGRLTVPKRAIGMMVRGYNQACALGAIYVGYGAVVEHIWADQYDLGDFRSPKALRSKRVTSPCSCEDLEDYKMLVVDLIPHLNDDHRWSDDKIVGWLQSLGL